MEPIRANFKQMGYPPVSGKIVAFVNRDTTVYAVFITDTGKILDAAIFYFEAIQETEAQP